MKKEEQKKDWRIIVECNGHPKEAMMILSSELGEKGNVFQHVDKETVNKWKFIMAVPVELAFDSESRKKLMKAQPECKRVVTEAPKTTEGLSKMCSEYGYRVLELPEDVRNPKPVKPDTCDVNSKVKISFNIDGKEVSIDGEGSKSVEDLFQDVISELSNYFKNK